MLGLPSPLQDSYTTKFQVSTCMELQDITSLQFNRCAAHMVRTAVVNNTEHALSRLNEVILFNSHEQFGRQKIVQTSFQHRRNKLFIFFATNYIRGTCKGNYKS